jgi:transcriptional regulator with XRE-family HTH domain
VSATPKGIPARLRAAREQAGLSQGQAARQLDMHRPTISEIEAGRRRIQVEELAQFAKLYKVSMSWLTSEAADDEAVDPRVELAARELRKLKQDDLDRVLRLLSSMREAPKGRKA